MLFISLQICRFCQEQRFVCCQRLIRPFQTLTSDFQLLFIDLKGQIDKTHLKFLEVPFIKSRQILNMYYTNPNYYDFWTHEMPPETSK